MNGQMLDAFRDYWRRDFHPNQIDNLHLAREYLQSVGLEAANSYFSLKSLVLQRRRNHIPSVSVRAVAIILGATALFACSGLETVEVFYPDGTIKEKGTLRPGPTVRSFTTEMDDVSFGRKYASRRLLSGQFTRWPDVRIYTKWNHRGSTRISIKRSMADTSFGSKAVVPEKL